MLPLARRSHNEDASSGILRASFVFCGRARQLNEANPFDYVTELQLHAEALAAYPERWMPWNYREALA